MADRMTSTEADATAAHFRMLSATTSDLQLASMMTAFAHEYEARARLKELGAPTTEQISRIASSSGRHKTRATSSELWELAASLVAWASNTETPDDSVALNKLADRYAALAVAREARERLLTGSRRGLL
jgi:hypothetical protein